MWRPSQTNPPLAPPPLRLLCAPQAYQFRFPRSELPHETYEGLNAVCRYYVRASVGRTATTSHATKEAEFVVQNPQGVSAEGEGGRGKRSTRCAASAWR